jgi:hypothetical protein
VWHAVLEACWGSLGPQVVPLGHMRVCVYDPYRFERVNHQKIVSLLEV